MPVGDYDKRIVLLTRERGKISAFAKERDGRTVRSWRRLTRLYSEATFYEGRTSYNLNQVSTKDHFVELAPATGGLLWILFSGAGRLFWQRGTDEKEMMNLLYVTIKAILISSYRRLAGALYL